MPRFFSKEVSSSNAIITGEDANHISKVLRCKIGENITVCDMLGNDYLCSISAIDTTGVYCSVNNIIPSVTEPNVNVVLYMALPKGDKSELIIQKAVELGVNKVVFIMTHRCVSRPDDKSWDKKLIRYNKIALEAAKQSQRGIIPTVEGILSYKQAIAELKKFDLPVVFYENATEKLSDILAHKYKNIGVLIGSEGGFEQSEIDFAIENNIKSLSLGTRILRCETAPIVAISAIMYSMGEF